MIHVVARVNLTRSSGAFVGISPAAGDSPPPDPEAVELGRRAGLSLELLDPHGHPLWEGPAPFYPTECATEDDDRAGLVDAFLPDAAGAASVRLRLSDRVIATLLRGAAPGPVTNIRALAGMLPRRDPIIVWDNEPRGGGSGRDEPPRRTLYTVQLSTDGGATWRTIGLGLERPSVTVDHRLLDAEGPVRVRVTSTDGFDSVAREAVLPLQALLAPPQLPGQDPESPRPHAVR
jgi:hypothetical protein